MRPSVYDNFHFIELTSWTHSRASVSISLRIELEYNAPALEKPTGARVRNALDKVSMLLSKAGCCSLFAFVLVCYLVIRQNTSTQRFWQRFSIRACS